MSKVRVYEIAKQIGISNKELLSTLKEFDIEVKNHMSSLTDEEVGIITEYFTPQENNETENAQEETEEISMEDAEIIMIPENITVKNLAEKLDKQSSELVKSLMLKGVMATANQEIDFETASQIAEEFDILLEKEPEKDIVEEFFAEEPDDEKDLVTRSPIVVVMGHVDHGKTSLLDAIRESNVTSREAGGITQHIGASVVTINDHDITFLDTPGHEAFTAMRLRGAMATDIAILVVAADDGVMPQTIEAINHAKAAGVQIIVAVNKIDKPGANQDRVKQELVEYGLVAEDWGGDTICVPVSAIEKTNLDQLLEMILLVSEMEELRANPNKKASGTIVEAQLDKGRGPVATVLIQNGTLKVGDSIIAGTSYGRIRAMIDDKGRRVKKAGPSTPVEILGLSEVPVAGDAFYTAKNEREARHVADKVIERNREKLLQNTPQKVTLDDLFTQIQSGNMKELNLVVKADVQGSVEAVKQSLVKLSNEEVVIKVIHGGVGAINESDVMLASASNAIIIGFNVRPEASAKAVADNEKIDIRLYRVIYNAIEDIEAAMKGMLDPEYREKVIGHAEIRQTFKVSGVGTIAGSYVLDGKFTRNSQVRLVRDGIVIYEGELASLKRFKDDVKEVNTGYECGIMLNKFNDVKESDIVEAFIMEEIPR
ncbi:MAG: translation initiation factor IF-2 [Vallitalea sp.]|jgi:translation initiation factor IF-2|nr:translation initiation factor IF-2 [Vallitalea sp.]